MKIAILLSLLLGAASTATSQYYFEKLTIENGLSDNRVTCFFKDKQDFMWIGTADGLNRYDGHSFRIYRAGQKNFAYQENISPAWPRIARTGCG